MRRKTYILWKRRLTIFVFFLTILGILYVYLRTGLFTIQNYVIVGAPENYTTVLENDMRLLAEEKLYKLLPGNRSISYHDDDIRTLIIETLPNTKDISIRPTGLHTLTIKLTQYDALFSISNTHAISSDGTIYKEIVPIDDLPRLSIATTTAVAPSTLVALSKLAQNVDTVLFDVHYIVIDEYNDIRLYDEAKRTSVIVTSTSDLNKSWSNILSAIDTDPLKKKLATKTEHLEYIDARFGNKVFYKFTNATVPAIIPPQTDESTNVATTTLH